MDTVSADTVSNLAPLDLLGGHQGVFDGDEEVLDRGAVKARLQQIQQAVQRAGEVLVALAVRQEGAHCAGDHGIHGNRILQDLLVRLEGCTAVQCYIDLVEERAGRRRAGHQRRKLRKEGGERRDRLVSRLGPDVQAVSAHIGNSRGLVAHCMDAQGLILFLGVLDGGCPALGDVPHQVPCRMRDLRQLFGVSGAHDAVQGHCVTGFWHVRVDLDIEAHRLLGQAFLGCLRVTEDGPALGRRQGRLLQFLRNRHAFQVVATQILHGLVVGRVGVGAEAGVLKAPLHSQQAQIHGRVGALGDPLGHLLDHILAAGHGRLGDEVKCPQVNRHSQRVHLGRQERGGLQVALKGHLKDGVVQILHEGDCTPVLLHGRLADGEGLAPNTAQEHTILAHSRQDHIVRVITSKHILAQRSAETHGLGHLRKERRKERKGNLEDEDRTKRLLRTNEPFNFFQCKT